MIAGSVPKPSPSRSLLGSLSPRHSKSRVNKPPKFYAEKTGCTGTIASGDWRDRLAPAVDQDLRTSDLRREPIPLREPLIGAPQIPKNSSRGSFQTTPQGPHSGRSTLRTSAPPRRRERSEARGRGAGPRNPGGSGSWCTGRVATLTRQGSAPGLSPRVEGLAV